MSNWQPSASQGRKGSQSSANSKKTELDFGFDDADLDDLLNSSDDDGEPAKPAQKGDDGPAVQSNPVTAAPASTPTPTTNTPTPKPATSAIKPAFHHAAPVPVPKKGVGKPGGSVEDILKGLDEFDDDDAGFLSKPAAGLAAPPAHTPTEGLAGGTSVGKDSLKTDFGATFTARMPAETHAADSKPQSSVKAVAGKSDFTSTPTLPKPLLPWEKRAADTPPPVPSPVRIDSPRISTVGQSASIFVPSSTVKPPMPWEKKAASPERDPSPRRATESSPKFPATAIAAASNPPSPARPRSVSSPPKTAAAPEDSGDDLLDMLGFNDRPKPVNAPPQQTLLTTATAAAAAAPKATLFPASVPRAMTTLPFATPVAQPLKAAAGSIPLTDGGDEFIPSFLLEASGPRRSRRPGTEPATIPTFSPPKPQPATTTSFNLPFLQVQPKAQPQPGKSSGTPSPLPPVDDDDDEQPRKPSSAPEKPIKSAESEQINATNIIAEPSKRSKSVPSARRQQQSTTESKPAARRPPPPAPTLTKSKQHQSNTSLSSLAVLSDLEVDDDDDDESGAQTPLEDDESDIQSISLSESDLALSSDTPPPSPPSKQPDRNNATKVKNPATEVGNGLASVQMNKETLDKLAALEAEIARLKTQMQEKADASDKATAEKLVLLNESHTRELAQITESHKAAIAACAESQTSAVAAVTAAHAEQIATLTKTAETLQLKADERDAKIRTLEEKLFAQAREHELEREATYTTHNEETVALHKALAAERVKIQGLLETLETTLQDTHAKTDTDRRDLVEDRARIVAQLQHLQAEKTTWLANHQQDRTAFLEERADFALERKRVLEQFGEERRSIAMDRAEIQARRHAVEEQEHDFELRQSRTAAQLQADEHQHQLLRTTLQAAQNAVHHQAAALRAEKLGLDAQRTQLSVERAAFEAEREATEKMVRDMKAIGEEAAADRQKAQDIEAAARITQAEVAAALAKLQEQQASVADAHKRMYDERIALANGRRDAFRAGSSDFVDQRSDRALVPRLVPTSKPALRGDSQNFTARDNSYRSQLAPQTTKPSPPPPPAPIQEDVPYTAAQYTAQDLCRKLERFVGGLSRIENTLDAQLTYLATSRAAVTPRVGWA
ncbi:hypothetical protein HDU86_004250 [Geranomyces michiganensis]|nr:hypothetical protein HDU86_004250 [Geranomyces michiganensis]